jgi:hypothetical protein
MAVVSAVHLAWEIGAAADCASGILGLVKVVDADISWTDDLVDGSAAGGAGEAVVAP